MRFKRFLQVLCVLGLCVSVPALAVILDEEPAPAAPKTNSKHHVKHHTEKHHGRRSSHEKRQSFEPEMVKLPNGLWMGKYEVTQGQWLAVMGTNPSNFSSCGLDCPVTNVSKIDAEEYIKKLNAKTGKNYRLPLSEEWFAACQAGKSTKYCGSDDFDSVAWYKPNSDNTPHPVGQKRANAYGLYDMSGNVSEWTDDYFGGGGWDALPPEDMREHLFSNEARPTFDSTFDSVGFRLIRM